MSELRCTRHRQERGNTAAVIGDSRRSHAASLAMNFHLRARGKNRIEMRGDDDDFFFIHAAQLCDDVSGLIDLHRKSSFGKQLLDRRSTLRFLKRRRRNLRNTRLLVIDPGNVRGKPIKSRADSRVIGKA